MPTISANGDIAESPNNDKKHVLSIGGTWGSGSLGFFIAKNGESYVPLNVVVTQDGLYEIDLPGSHKVKATLSGATAPSLTYNWLS